MPTSKTPLLTERAKRALNLAFEIHIDQIRKSRGGQIPYFSHLSTVAGMVLELGGSEDEFIAAILHDSVEDQADKLCSLWMGKENRQLSLDWRPTTAEEKTDTALRYLREEFGDAPADIVKQLTDDKLPREFKKLPLERRIVFINESREKKFEKFRQAGPSVRRIKACDALHNLRSLYQDYKESSADIWQNFAAGEKGTIHYYEQLSAIFMEHGPARAAIEMNHVLGRLKNSISADKG